MQAIILAAGMGKRLKELTQNNTKCMVEVNGTTIIERCLRILDTKHLSRIVIVVGYKGDNLINYVGSLNICTPICFVNNTIYDKTNNIYSLALAKEYLCAEDTLLFESDLVFDERIVDMLIEDERDTLAVVDKFESWMDGTCMELDENDCITNFIPGKGLDFKEKQNYYKTVNIYKFSRHFSVNTYIPFLSAYEQSMGENEYYESVIRLIAMLDTKEIRALRLSGQVWYEIDNIQDLDIAESLFADSDESYFDKIAERYGGYWRYPKMLDFCYLVNPYYPPNKLLEEMKSNFDELIMDYPSGMRVNSLLASNIFGVLQSHIVVGNGAAELIKALIENMEGKIGVIRPTFEEYPNRGVQEKIVDYWPAKEGFRYDVKELMTYFEGKELSAIVLINPDNPSGNYIKKSDVILFIEWCKKRDIKLILDESFVDFVDLESSDSTDDTTMIKEEILGLYNGLYIVKSISKSYGIPGIRLGVLSSADELTISRIKKDVAIWNINSFGEFYMQIAEKYKKDYEKSLKRIRMCRKRFMEQLSNVGLLEVYPSQGNYVLCEVKGKSSRDVCVQLLKKRIFIKDLTSKINNGRQYIRIAVRNEEDNELLIKALNQLD